jgi:hypothetical protein
MAKEITIKFNMDNLQDEREAFAIFYGNKAMELIYELDRKLKDALKYGEFKDDKASEIMENLRDLINKSTLLELYD